MHYRQTKVQSLQAATIPVDAEIVAIIRAQQQVSRRFAARMGLTGQDPRYLFLRERENRNCQHRYPMASLHARLKALSQRLQIIDIQGRPVAIGRTHRFRHTAATNLLVHRVECGRAAARGHALLRATDMPWGQRFAIVLDPDGNRVGLKAPRV